jgi:DNA-binding CsgD family transcriptional regulator
MFLKRFYVFFNIILNHLFKRGSLILLITFSLQSTAQNAISETKIDSLCHSVDLPSIDSLLLLRGEIEFHKVELRWQKNYRENKATLLKVLKEIERLAVSNKNPELEIRAALWLFYIQEGMYTPAEPMLGYEKLVKRAENSEIFSVELEARQWFANYLIKSKDPAIVESAVLILKENIAKINKKNDRNLARLLLEAYQTLIGYYYRLDDLPNAIVYSKKALGIKFPEGLVLVPGDPQIIAILNNLGVFYREQQALDSSSFYFRKVINITSRLKSSVYYEIASGNLGENLYLQGNYKEALPLLQVDANLITESKNWGNASNALILIADIYLREGDLKMAKQFSDKATIAAHASNELKRLGKLYPFLSKYYKTIGQLNLALAYADSTIVVMDSIKTQNNEFYGLKADQLFNEYQLKIEAQEALLLQEIAIKKRNIGLLVLLLLITSGYFIFRNYHLKAKLKEINLIKEAEQAKDELARTKEQLDTHVQKIIAQHNSVNWKKIKINSDEQWEQFLELFQKLHPEFIYKTKSNFLSITAGELRLLCLMRIGLDDLNIASILAININSVSQTRRRFMRKANIENIHELKELIYSI